MLHQGMKRIQDHREFMANVKQWHGRIESMIRGLASVISLLQVVDQGEAREETFFEKKVP